jgi:hypothetical protein
MDYLVKEAANRMATRERIEERKKKKQNASPLMLAQLRSHGLELEDLKDLKTLQAKTGDK